MRSPPWPSFSSSPPQSSYRRLLLPSSIRDHPTCLTGTINILDSAGTNAPNDSDRLDGGSLCRSRSRSSDSKARAEEEEEASTLLEEEPRRDARRASRRDLMESQCAGPDLGTAVVVGERDDDDDLDGDFAYGLVVGIRVVVFFSGGIFATATAVVDGAACLVVGRQHPRGRP